MKETPRNTDLDPTEADNRSNSNSAAAAETPGGNPQAGTEDDKKPALTVEIRKYQTLLEILDNPKHGLKVFASLLVLVTVVFMALAFITIAIKRIYPYNEIKTNAFGATTMQSEDVELTYWLFNTAELWANSGIRVEAGDILTIRASGRSNTAIHHLVDAASENQRLRHRWVGTEGEPRPDNARTEFRLYPERDPDALIMQVIPESEAKVFHKELKDMYLNPRYGDDDAAVTKNFERMYYIGKEHTDLVITQSGILHFAVNDIVLTEECIDEMLKRNEDLIKGHLGKIYDGTISYWPLVDKICGLRKECDNLKKDYMILCRDSVELKKKHDSTELKKAFDIIKQQYNDKIKEIVDSLNKHKSHISNWDQANQECGMKLGPHPVALLSGIDDKNYEDNINYNLSSENIIQKYNKDGEDHKNNANNIGGESFVCKDLEDIIAKNILPFYNEMHYYKYEKYVDAWFEDNVGSFLIVIERRKNR